MDRPIIYTEEQGRGYDVSKGWQDTFISVGQLCRDILSYAVTYTGGQTVVAGCLGTQSSPASLTIDIGSGGIYALGVCDPSPEGDLPADGTTRFMQGQTAGTAVALSTSALSAGQSQWALVQAIFAFSDIVRAGDPSAGVLPFYNAANPTSPLQGQGGSGALLNTEHQATVSFSVVYGTPATTGSEVPPSAASGHVGLYLIDLAYGQTAITTGEILVAGPSVGTGVPSNYPAAPFLAGLLSSHHNGNPGQAPKVNLATETQGTLPAASLPFSITSGTFTATLTGMASTTTGTINYSVMGNIVVLYNNGTAITGTSNSGSMTMTGFPSGIIPANHGLSMDCGNGVEDNGVQKRGVASWGSAPALTFLLDVVSGTYVSPGTGSFTTTGTKGIEAGWTVTYPLT
jgi:hypothetical protein